MHKPFTYCGNARLLLNNVQCDQYLQQHKYTINAQQCKALTAEQLLFHQCHNADHQGNFQHQGGVLTEDGTACRHGEGRDGYCHTRHQHQIKDVCTDDVTQRQCAVSFSQSGNSGYELRQAGAQCNHGHTDHLCGDTGHQRQAG